MSRSPFRSSLLPFLLVVFLVMAVSCRSIKPIEDQTPSGYKTADISAEEIGSRLLRSDRQLNGIRGKGKALISTPDQSDRVTLYFAGNRDSSHITIQNRLGMKGGELLTTGDSILIYNKVDKEAHKISYADAHHTQLNSLASANLVEVLNYKINTDRIDRVLASPEFYLLIMNDDTRIRLDRNNYHIKEVQLSEGRQKPYNQIQYENYEELDGFLLPRKLTVTSADRRSRVTLLIRSLSVNPRDLTLSVDLPDNIMIQRP